eukprot:Trichotokara_eunicae@DN4720_c0_g1_i1.p1
MYHQGPPSVHAPSQGADFQKEIEEQRQLLEKYRQQTAQQQALIRQLTAQQQSQMGSQFGGEPVASITSPPSVVGYPVPFPRGSQMSIPPGVYQGYDAPLHDPSIMSVGPSPSVMAAALYHEDLDNEEQRRLEDTSWSFQNQNRGGEIGFKARTIRNKKKNACC